MPMAFLQYVKARKARPGVCKELRQEVAGLSLACVVVHTFLVKSVARRRILKIP